MLYFAGIDIGSLCTKSLILNEDDAIIGTSIKRSGAAYRGAGEDALNAALKDANLKSEDLNYIISTGYGRSRIPIADEQITEITCHARGSSFIFPEARAVIDIGGQDSKVIEINSKGRVLKFVMNDKCAAGTGRFLEVMAGSLDIDLEQMSELAKQSKKEVQISSMCTVFAESEVISLFAGGTEKAEIASGIYRAIARRVTGLASHIVSGKKVTMTGGVAKSKGMVWALSKKLKTELLVADDPQIIGALGAALIAKTKFNNL